MPPTRRSSASTSSRPTRRSCTRASPSRSTATSRAPSASSRTTCCRASSPRAEWSTLERGLTQRLTALNLFLKDIYHEGRILAEGVVPRELVYSCRHYRREMRGVHVHRDIYVSVAGTDLVRLAGRPLRRARGQPARAERRVLHAREPRRSSSACFPALFDRYDVSPIASLRPGAARHAAGAGAAAPADPTIVVLTPGVGNSAYFEHAFLARQMGIELVEGRDLLVHDNIVYMRTTGGPAARGRDLPPRGRRLPRSAGVPAPTRSWAWPACSTRTAPATCRWPTPIGTGVADDKALYAYVPAIIKFYLSEEPILPNVETYLLSNADRPAVRARAPRRSSS